MESLMGPSASAMGPRLGQLSPTQEWDQIFGQGGKVRPIGKGRIGAGLHRLDRSYDLFLSLFQAMGLPQSGGMVQTMPLGLTQGSGPPSQLTRFFKVRTSV